MLAIFFIQKFTLLLLTEVVEVLYYCYYLFIIYLFLITILLLYIQLLLVKTLILNYITNITYRRIRFMVTIFNFNNFDKNPIVQYCLDSYKDKQILTEKDVKDIIPHLKHSKWALENKKWSFVGDELRLYLSTLSDDFTYVDADCRVLNIDELNMNKCCLEPDGVTNDGSFFRANNKTQWTKQLVEVYETMPESNYETVNYVLHKDHPEIKIPTQQLNYSHYFLSWFGRLAKSLKSPCIYYTLFWDRAVKELYKGHDVVWLNTAASQTYFSKYNATIWRYFIIPIDLFQAQLDYSCGRHISLINLDNTL